MLAWLKEELETEARDNRPYIDYVPERSIEVSPPVFPWVENHYLIGKSCVFIACNNTMMVEEFYAAAEAMDLTWLRCDITLMTVTRRRVTNILTLGPCDMRIRDKKFSSEFTLNILCPPSRKNR